MKHKDDTIEQKVAYDIFDMADELNKNKGQRNPDVVLAFKLGYGAAMLDLQEEISKKYKLLEKHR